MAGGGFPSRRVWRGPERWGLGMSRRPARIPHRIRAVNLSRGAWPSDDRFKRVMRCYDATQDRTDVLAAVLGACPLG